MKPEDLTQFSSIPAITKLSIDCNFAIARLNAVLDEIEKVKVTLYNVYQLVNQFQHEQTSSFSQE